MFPHKSVPPVSDILRGKYPGFLRGHICSPRLIRALSIVGKFISAALKSVVISPLSPKISLPGPNFTLCAPGILGEKNSFKNPAMP